MKLSTIVSKSPTRPTTRRSRRAHLVLCATLAGLAPLVAGCSSQAIVAGNVVSMLATFALFYTTINLRPRR